MAKPHTRHHLAVPLECVFYAEFDNEAGPVVLFCAPEDYKAAEILKQAGDYIICPNQLCNRIVSICVGSKKIVGFNENLHFLSHFEFGKNRKAIKINGPKPIMYNKYINILPIFNSKALSNVVNPPKVRIEIKTRAPSTYFNSVVRNS